MARRAEPLDPDRYQIDHNDWLTSRVGFDGPINRDHWVVRGGRNYKGFGRIPRFCGSKAECEAVAQALNFVARGGRV